MLHTEGQIKTIRKELEKRRKTTEFLEGKTAAQKHSRNLINAISDVVSRALWLCCTLYQLMWEPFSLRRTLRKKVWKMAYYISKTLVPPRPWRWERRLTVIVRPCILRVLWTTSNSSSLLLRMSWISFPCQGTRRTVWFRDGYLLSKLDFNGESIVECLGVSWLTPEEFD
jgi:hypothetical protein